MSNPEAPGRQLSLDEANDLAAKIEQENPELARKIRERIADFVGCKRESLNISVSGRITVEKFDGEYSPDKKPVETIVREGI